MLAAVAQAQTPATQLNAAAEELEEITVTGSRVIKNGNDSPTPVTVLSVADSEVVHPGTIADQLNDLPQFSGSRGQLTNPQVGNNNSGAPNQQANALNLRNFGLNRTLILVDGHRVAPTNPDGTVDVDMIPQLLLQRVDIVTGGASAVYGSDAMTGVVNFVTDTRFVGLKINGQVGESTYHDDPRQALGLAWGADLFGGRGHLEASYEYRNDAGVDRRSTRPFFASRPVVEVVSTTTASSTYQLFYNVTGNAGAFGGLISAVAGQPANPLAGQYFVSNGVLAPFNKGAVINNSNFSVGGNGTYFDTSLAAALREHQLFARFDYDFTDAVHGYAKVAGTYNYNNQYSLNQGLYNPGSSPYAYFSSDPYLPAQYQAQLQAAGVTRFALARTGLDEPRQDADSIEYQGSVDLGLSGKFGNGYKWELALVLADNTAKTTQQNTGNGLRAAAAADAVTVTAANVGNSGLPIGSTACYVTLAFPGLYPGCIPVNPFGPNTFTAEQNAWLFQAESVTARTTMADVEANVTGAPVSSWAGPVNMALSGQLRRLTYALDSTTQIFSPLNPLNCTGLRLITCTPTSQEWNQEATAASPQVSTTVKEMAYEFDLPLIKNGLLTKDVSFNGAVRFTDYSTSGSVSTWKAGLDWKLSDSLTFRGTRSRDITAPSLFQLFQPVTVGNYNQVDFLTSVVLNNTTVASDGKIYPNAPTYSQGNHNLTPEVGNTTTIGFVWRPGWAPNLSVSLDSYFINVTDAIVNENGTSNSIMLACANSGGTSPLCSLIVRPIDCCSKVPANSATALYQTYVNIANQWTEGGDFEINYTGRVFERPYSFRMLTAYQPHNVNSSPGLGTVDNAGYFGSSPIWRAEAMGSISPLTNFTVSVQERWRNSMTWVPRQSAPLPTLIFLGPNISPVYYTNLNLSYLFKHIVGGQTELYANIENLFNRAPPVSASINNVQPGIFGVVLGDDVIGRYYTLGFRYRH
jgi:outer membrane receptor protein involved in Fe transport